MQEAMARPEVQKQMSEMQSYMANPALQQRMATLRDDPEFAEVFAEIQAGAWQRAPLQCMCGWGSACVELGTPAPALYSGTMYRHHPPAPALYSGPVHSHHPPSLNPQGPPGGVGR